MTSAARSGGGAPASPARAASTAIAGAGAGGGPAGTGVEDAPAGTGVEGGSGMASGTTAPLPFVVVVGTCGVSSRGVVGLVHVGPTAASAAQVRPPSTSHVPGGWAAADFSRPILLGSV